MMKNFTKKQTIKLVQEFIDTNNMDITLEEIQKIIYESKEYNELLQLWIMLCEKAGLALNQVQIDLVMNCWNNFPHKKLGGKAPKVELFSHIPQYQDITFVTNETLCDPYLPINGNRIHSDPFFENNQNIFRRGNVFLNKETQFFPDEVGVEDRVNKTSFILDKHNEFSYKNEGGKADGVFCFTYISVCGDFIRLEKTGKELQDSGLVNKLSNLSPRWCINRKN